jgi:hypothetical protein
LTVFIWVKKTRAAADPAGSGLIIAQIFIFRDNPLKYTDLDGRSDWPFGFTFDPRVIRGFKGGNPLNHNPIKDHVVDFSSKFVPEVYAALDKQLNE